jgi:hypothetical protein
MGTKIMSYKKCFPSVAARLTLALFGLFSTPAEAYRLRGYSEINAKLTLRLLDASHPNSAQFQINNYFGAAAFNLSQLLGGFATFDSKATFVNPAPNAANLTFYFVLFEAFATDISNLCYGPVATIPFSTDFQSLVAQLCHAPWEFHFSDDSLMQELWLSLVGYDLPMTEYFAWRDEFRSAYWKAEAKADWINSQIVALLMNPYFLLRN